MKQMHKDEVNGCSGGTCCCSPAAESQADPEIAAMEGKSIAEVTLRIEGLDCGDCAAKVEKAVGQSSGVVLAKINFAAGKMKIQYDPIVVQKAEIEKLIRGLGYKAISDEGSRTSGTKTVLGIEGMDCGDCAAKLEKRIADMQGVQSVAINFGAGKMTVEHTIDVQDIMRVVEQAGYKAILQNTQMSQDIVRTSWWSNPRTLATITSGVLLVIAMLLDWLGSKENIVISVYGLGMLIGGYHVVKNGYYAMRNLTPDMNFLMTLAAIGAAAIGEWSEGATVVFLFALGNALQSYTMDKTRASIRALMELAPPDALVRRNGQETRLPVEEIKVGDVIIVKPGERIAMDGGVIDGASTVNQATITGESMPVEKKMGDIVYAGTVNEHGVLEVAVTKLVGDSTLAKIMHLVEEAQAQKAPSQQLVDTFAKYYTPAIIGMAMGVILIPWLFFHQTFDIWFYRALVLLVIACPCALVISTPVSIVSAIGNASRHGVLIKGGAYLEEMSNIRAVAFDKTGTLTEGRLTVTDILPVIDGDENELLALAATVERWSEHPIALAITQRAKGLPTKSITNFKAIVGRGAQAEIDGETVYVGNLRLFKEIRRELGSYESMIRALEEQGKTVMLVGTKDTIYGILAVADTIRKNSAEAIRTLQAAGIKHITMLTGDNERVARAIAGKLGIDAFYGELMPEDKAKTVLKLAHQYGSVAMVGDGVNDAPALAAANVGIAMGVVGSDTALETADIALMSDDLGKLSDIIKLSRKTVTIIKQNIVFSLAVKIAFVMLTITGFANLWMAVFADTGAAILVTLNGMRLARK
jgi:Zn2+/Cd2+-exporting ATPase